VGRQARQTVFNVVGLDTGTSFGYAHLRAHPDRVEHVRSGLWDLNVFDRKKRGRRLGHCYELLGGLFDTLIDAVCYEDVARHRGVKAAHSFGAFESIVQMVAAYYGVPWFGYFPGTLKKEATGFGHASKQEVSDAMAKMFNITILGDDHSDALACALVGIAKRPWEK
jgi:Holliday junction resolvasome RuvABC endonuclease subunit